MKKQRIKMSKLKPCPKCGSLLVVCEKYPHTSKYFVRCDIKIEGCGLRTLLYKRKYSAIQAWNKTR